MPWGSPIYDSQGNRSQSCRDGADIGNHIDDGNTLVTLPFPFQLYNPTSMA